LILIGIYTQGVPLANLIASQIESLEGVKVPVGAIELPSLATISIAIKTRTPAKTKMPLDVTGKTVILVDDVIYKGRTICAAFNAIIEYGRPQKIRLLVLVDRRHRELPIHPDFTGKKLPLQPRNR
jgi:pyrimidine operon attenuation protein/uracil phosphoribosyltransferase